MLEVLINPRHAEKKPWMMFFIGLLYAALALAIADLVFLRNPVFEQHLSIIVVFFTVMFSLPFMFYIIKQEEEKDIKIEQERTLIKEHGKALSALLFLFLGYVVAFSLLYMIVPDNLVTSNFKIQVETYCSINSPSNFEGCVAEKITTQAIEPVTTGGIVGSMQRLSTILSNNFYVLLMSLLFSFVFGAGAIFILAWNASVIAAAVGIFSQHAALLHQGLLRYLFHGILEIAAYFVAALAGGIIGIAVIKHEFRTERFWHVLKDSLDMIILALIILLVAGFVEVFITPVLF
jgi:stage II sporulation protein M